MIELKETINDHFEDDPITVTINDQYYNMGEQINQNPHVIEIAKRAFNNLDIVPNTDPIRGGTDGSQLSFKGLPTPNIFTGCANFHGPFEYASIDVMEQAVHVVVNIAQEVVHYYEEN